MSFISKYERHNNISIDEIRYEIPDIQRSVNAQVVQEIIKFQLEFFELHKEYCLNSTLSIAINDQTGVQYLLDGQHRLQAYKELRKQYPERKMLASLDIYTFDGVHGAHTNLELIYKYINTHTPNDIQRMGIDEYKTLNTFERKIRDQFPTYFKSSGKPHRPSINLTNVKEYILSSGLLASGRISTGDELFQIVLDLNKFYSLVPGGRFGIWGIKDYNKIIDKINAHPNKLYLGLYSNNEWIDRIADHVITSKPFNEMAHISNTWCPIIGKRLREQVWSKTNNRDSRCGVCYCCADDITYDNFQCGHITAVALGGPTVLQNLVAICQACNQHMKTMNLEKYKDIITQQRETESMVSP